MLCKVLTVLWAVSSVNIVVSSDNRDVCCVNSAVLCAKCQQCCVCLLSVHCALCCVYSDVCCDKCQQFLVLSKVLTVISAVSINNRFV